MPINPKKVEFVKDLDHVFIIGITDGKKSGFAPVMSLIETDKQSVLITAIAASFVRDQTFLDVISEAIVLYLDFISDPKKVAAIRGTSTEN